MRLRELARHEARLGFVPRPSVRWLVPSELARSGIQVVIAKVFADYSDKREMQAVLPQEALALDSADGELWFDFVADLGDGFDATYTVASLLAQPQLTVTGPDGGELTLPRGELLVMGGDQVYPVASSTAYEDRTTGLYSAALPAGTARAQLLALPGNHDWYDGLTAFLRTFTTGRSIGAWRTFQSRSYFAARLRPGWWLVGLDSQLGEHLDQPQLDYFARTITAELQPGDAIILCSASPAWERTVRDPDAFNTLHFFERNFLRNRIDTETGELVPTGANVRLWISGDRHHYTRYEEEIPDAVGPDDPRRAQLITSGLGGAYLMGVDDSAATLRLPLAESRMRRKDPVERTYRRAEAMFPTPALARRLSWGLANPFSPYWLPTRNGWFGFTMGAVQLALVLALCWVLSVTRSSPVAEAVRDADGWEAFTVAGFVLGIPLLLVTAGIAIGAWRRGRLGRYRVTGLAGVAVQCLVGFVLFEVIVLVPLPSDSPTLLALVCVIAAVGGAVLGSEAFALWVLCAVPSPVGDLKMTALAYEGGKGFVRLHLTADGGLEIYPLVTERICHDWSLEDTSGRLRPVASAGLPVPRLIEHPIRVSRSASAPPG